MVKFDIENYTFQRWFKTSRMKMMISIISLKKTKHIVGRSILFYTENQRVKWHYAEEEKERYVNY